MADDPKMPEKPEATLPTPPAVQETPRKVTDNPGEGEYMFTDWALI